MDFNQTVKLAAEIAARHTAVTFSTAREIAARMATAADDDGIAYDAALLAEATIDRIFDEGWDA
jgi:hypothetical protein